MTDKDKLRGRTLKNLYMPWEMSWYFQFDELSEVEARGGSQKVKK